MQTNNKFKQLNLAYFQELNLALKKPLLQHVHLPNNA